MSRRRLAGGAGGGSAVDRDRPLVLQRARVPFATSRKTADCASAWRQARPPAAGAGGISLRTRSRAAVSSCQGGGAGGGAAGSASAGCDAPGWLNKMPSFSDVWSRGAGPATGGSGERCPRCRRSARSKQCCAISFNSPDDNPEAEHDHAGARRDHTGKDLGIAEAEFLDPEFRRRFPKGRPAKSRSRQSTAQLTSNSPLLRPNAAQPPTPRYRHIVCTANRQLRGKFPPETGPIRPNNYDPDPNFRPTRGARRSVNPLKCCDASGQLRHNSQLPGKGTALYGCRGMRPKSAKAGPPGTPGYQ